MRISPYPFKVCMRFSGNSSQPSGTATRDDSPLKLEIQAMAGALLMSILPRTLRMKEGIRWTYHHQL